jgi:anaerobic selenocysteine-containing dehydrogenase
MKKEIHNTTCTMDCPDACALEVEVQDGRITKISGRDDHPTTAGFICSKVSQFAKRVYHKDRLLYPMRRTGTKGEGKFERITWDDAIAEITSRFKDIASEFGSEAILPYHYGGSNGLLGDDFLDDYFFAQLGASRLAKTLCAIPTKKVATAMNGRMPGVAFEDFPYARFILIWGANPKASNIHLVPFLKKAKKNGAFIAVVDPTKNFSDVEVDLHLPVYPGADLPLALSMISYWQENDLLDLDFLNRHCDGLETLLDQARNWPIEKGAKEARVNAEDVRTLAMKYAESSPAVLRCGWGLERNRNGGQAVAAILAMPALLGKFGMRGGGYTLSNSGAVKVDTEKIFGNLNWNTRIVNMSQIGKVLTGDIDPPVKALFIYNCNPAVTAPDQNAVLKGLQREDLFTVVFEQVMTDTAQFADILLPAVTFPEQKEIKRGYGSYVVGSIHPAISPCGEAKSNEEVFAALGRAIGFMDKPFFWSTDDHMQKVSAALHTNGKTLEFDPLQIGKIHPVKFQGETPIQFKTVLPSTPDGKVHLSPDVLGEYPFSYNPVNNARFPLALISPANSKMISSTMGEFNYPQLVATIHPEDASLRKIETGDTMRVFNELGEVICRAKVSSQIRSGVVSMPKGAWRKSSLNAQTSTALCPSHVNVVGGGACFNDARVEIEKI